MTGEATLSNEKNYFDADKFLEPIKGVKVANG